MSTVIHTTTKPAVEVTAYHTSLYDACVIKEKALDTMAKKFNALIKSKYGDVCPTFDQYSADQHALAHIAKERGLKDNQWVRKPYAAQIKFVYGALPVAMTPVAIAKRAQREADAAAKKAAGAQPAAGAPIGKPQEKPVSAAESIEQLIARIGLFETLEACTRILADERKTADKAKALASLTAQMRREASPADSKKAA